MEPHWLNPYFRRATSTVLEEGFPNQRFVFKNYRSRQKVCIKETQLHICMYTLLKIHVRLVARLLFSRMDYNMKLTFSLNDSDDYLWYGILRYHKYKKVDFFIFTLKIITLSKNISSYIWHLMVCHWWLKAMTSLVPPLFAPVNLCGDVVCFFNIISLKMVH